MAKETKKTEEEASKLTENQIIVLKAVEKYTKNSYLLGNNDFSIEHIEAIQKELALLKDVFGVRMGGPFKDLLDYWSFSPTEIDTKHIEYEINKLKEQMEHLTKEIDELETKLTDCLSNDDMEGAKEHNTNRKIRQKSFTDKMGILNEKEKQLKAANQNNDEKKKESLLYQLKENLFQSGESNLEITFSKTKNDYKTTADFNKAKSRIDKKADKAKTNIENFLKETYKPESKIKIPRLSTTKDKYLPRLEELEK